MLPVTHLYDENFILRDPDILYSLIGTMPLERWSVIASSDSAQVSAREGKGSMIGIARGSWPTFAPACALSLFLCLIAGLGPVQARAQTAVNPTVTLNPISGGPGTDVTATGSGWGPGSVVVSWDGSQPRGTAAVSSGGDWQLAFSVPAEASTGSHTITFDENAPGAAITIVKTFLVTAASSPASSGAPVPSVAAPPVTGTGGYRNAGGFRLSNPLLAGLVLAGLVLVLGSLVARRSSR